MNNTEQDRATRAAETAARAAAGLNLADNNPLSGRPCAIIHIRHSKK